MTQWFSAEILTLFWTAVALGTDAFSLGLGMGMQGLRRRQIVSISTTIGVFHVLMPLVGLITGLYLHQVLGDVAQKIAALLLVGLGLHMMYYALSGKEETPPMMRQTSGWGVLLFAMSVSVDALSVGFSFGLSDAHVGYAVTMFGIVGGVMAAMGLSAGSFVSKVAGGVVEALGGAILAAFGVQLWM